MAATQSILNDAPSGDRRDNVAPSTAAPSSTTEREAARPAHRRLRPYRPPTDDEILGLDSSVIPNPDPTLSVGDSGERSAFAVRGQNQKQIPRTSSRAPENQEQSDSARDSARNDNESVSADTAIEPENLRAAFDANPELRAAWQDAHSYRESFATPEEARAATAALADLDRMDALFFSRRPEDHAELARAVAALDPAAFASLAQAMSAYATSAPAVGARYIVPGTDAWRDAAHSASAHNSTALSSRARPTAGFSQPADEGSAVGFASEGQNRQMGAGATTPAQIQFLHSANTAAVRNVIDAIETQVERLLPEGVSKTARNRVVGEIYRELDGTLRSNRQLAQQMRDAFKAGPLDADHERALVSLVTSRARQALPGVAKRVMNEWTSTIVAANNDRRTRQRAAENRVDIAGSGRAGNDGVRPLSPRDLDYARLSDSDILNM